MARIKHGIVMKRRKSTPESDVRSELRSACKADDVQRVAELVDNGSITAADATACIEETTENLEHGADPAACATTWYMLESIELIKLIVEFGYDIRVNGHWILQYLTLYRDHAAPAWLTCLQGSRRLSRVYRLAT
jgi:hypothetical protein